MFYQSTETKTEQTKFVNISFILCRYVLNRKRCIFSAIQSKYKFMRMLPSVCHTDDGLVSSETFLRYCGVQQQGEYHLIKFIYMNCNTKLPCVFFLCRGMWLFFSPWFGIMIFVCLGGLRNLDYYILYLQQAF